MKLISVGDFFLKIFVFKLGVANIRFIKGIGKRKNHDAVSMFAMGTKEKKKKMTDEAFFFFFFKREPKENQKWNIKGHLLLFFFRIKREHKKDLSQTHHLHTHILMRTNRGGEKSRKDFSGRRDTLPLLVTKENANFRRKVFVKLI